MGNASGLNDVAIGNGGAGTSGAWDIICSTAHDLEDKIVVAFMCLTAGGGLMTEMEEQTTIGKAGKAGVSTPVTAKYLGYTYPQYVIFEGRYTSLIPAAGLLFKVWFLK